MTIFGSTTRLHAQTGGEAVGNLSGQLTVSDMGAAVYSLTFDVPDGGPLTPQIGIAYNSQTAGYGLAGYGFNITGISCITRGGKDLFHNQTVQGVTYTDADNFFLDGKRLILKEGEHGKDGSKYCLEGDPYTDVLMHNKVKTTYIFHDPGAGDVYYDNPKQFQGVPDSLITRVDETIFWFEVSMTNGQKLEYGKTPDSKLMYTNRRGQEHIAAWYVNKATDQYYNYIDYIYSVKNCTIKPRKITFGKVGCMANNECNEILFHYQSLGNNARTFCIEDQIGKIDSCLSAIDIYKNNYLYRKYHFNYDDTSDLSVKKWHRLTSVVEENGKGERLRPLEFSWEFLPGTELECSKIENIKTEENKMVSYDKSDNSFFAVDLNGDGISDIIRLTPVRKMDGSGELCTLLSISESLSYADRTGNHIVHFSNRIPDTLSFTYKMEYFDVISKNTLCSPEVMDCDGDGYNDLVMMSRKYQEDDGHTQNSFIRINFMSGKTKQWKNYKPYILPKRDSKILSTSFDVNGDGKNQMIIVEDAKSNGKYPCYLVSFHNDEEPEYKPFFINLASKPKWIFNGDYDNDGLTDLMLIHEKGYEIFYNSGSSEMVPFSEDNSYYGFSLCSHKEIVQGDFNGDGLLDFAYRKDKECDLWIAYNVAGRGFDIVKHKDIIYPYKYEVRNQRTVERREEAKSISLLVFDVNYDGCSDILVSQSKYTTFLNEKRESVSSWILENKVLSFPDRDSYVDLSLFPTKETKTKVLQKCLVGDFDGDGFFELANYGSSLDSITTSYQENEINVYKIKADLSKIGKITRIKDALGNESVISYDNLTNPNIYNKKKVRVVKTEYNDYGQAVIYESIETPQNYPVNLYTLPLSVVSKVSSDIGSFGSKTLKYQYEDLKIHIAGGGMLGFDKITTKEYDNRDELISTKITAIKERDEKHLLPIEVADTCWIGDNYSTSLTKTSIVEHGGTFFSYVSEKKMTDLEGNQAWTSSQYDVSKGVVIHEKVTNEADQMFKEVKYTYPEKANAFGAWLPESMTMMQKHRDDEAPFSTTTTYRYDNIGNLLSTTVNAGTDLALTTTATYDKYGNVLCSVDSGYGVVSVKQLNDYDETGRYLLRSYTYPESAVKEYAYDEMGNLVSETEITNPTAPLSTTYTYDGWGRCILTLSPDGIMSKTEMGWEDSDERKYYIKKTSDGQPPVTTWYDKGGYETYSETVGPQAPLGICISKTTEYTNKGQVEKVESQSGKLTVWQSFEYDERGRVVTEKSSTGKQTSYTYGNRTVTKDEDGREHTTLTDEWGNVIKTIDPMGNEVVYTYSSNGKPRSIASLNSVVNLEYDVAGNKTKLVDPDAGTMTYTYAADGTLLSQTDGKGIETSYTFDSLGRVIASNIGGKVITSEYGTSGNDNMRLKRQSLDGYIIEFQYDSLGRVIQQVRTVGQHGEYAFDYSYNKYGKLSETTYPGGLVVKHSYDKNGYKIKTTADGKVVYNLWQYDGLIKKSKFLDLTHTVERNQKGYEVTRWISKDEEIEYTPEQLDSIFSANPPFLSGQEGDDENIKYNFPDPLPAFETIILDQFNMKYDTITNNLLSRQRHDRPWEVFEYDELDRLCTVKVGNAIRLSMQYADNGNILQKSDVGEFSYEGQKRPHAVARIRKRIEGEKLGDELNTQFNSLGKIRLILDTKQNLAQEFFYGPDQQRWYSYLTDDLSTIKVDTEEERDKNTVKSLCQTEEPVTRLDDNLREIVYVGNYEKITENGKTREFYYLDGGAIIVKQNGVFTPYQAFTDNLGSVLSILNEEGEKVFDAEYDAWGNQTISKNEIGFQRGYTGHEMLNEFGIINMNGRLYDPVLGRFFSPDNYVQAPGNSQNFNRYSYCLNNPLKYTDPSGEVCGIDDAVIAFTILSVANSMMTTYCLSEGDWSATMKSGGIALLSSAATYGIGSACSAMTNAGMNAMSVGLINAGMHGLNSGLISAINGGSFGRGFITGAASAGIGSFANNVDMPTEAMLACTTAMGGAVAWATGGSFLEGAIRGMQIGAFNHAMHDDNEVAETLGLPEVIVTAESSSNASVALGAAAAVLWADDATVIGVADDLVAVGVSVAAGATWLYENRAAIENCLIRAYASINSMTNKTKECRPGYVYHLVALSDGEYPNVRGGMVSLKAGDTWKIGETINGLGRYPGSYLDDLNVKMVFRSAPMTNKYDLLIEEKRQLIKYYLQNGHLPPGNKMFK
jgi:RHS repeat-associated protein